MLCARCGYDMEGLTGRMCPECGLSPVVLFDRMLVSRSAATAAAACGWLGCGAMIVLWIILLWHEPIATRMFVCVWPPLVLFGFMFLLPWHRKIKRFHRGYSHPEAYYIALCPWATATVPAVILSFMP